MIYVVTMGDYSDYKIIGVFTIKEQANKVAKAYGGEVEEWNENEIGKDNYFPFLVRMQGETTHVYVQSSVDFINQVRGNSWPGYHDVYFVNVMAEDRDHAIKIGSDLIAQYKAQH